MLADYLQAVLTDGLAAEDAIFLHVNEERGPNEVLAILQESAVSYLEHLPASYNPEARKAMSALAASRAPTEEEMEPYVDPVLSFVAPLPQRSSSGGPRGSRSALPSDERGYAPTPGQSSGDPRARR